MSRKQRGLKMATEFEIGEVLPTPANQDELESIIAAIDDGRMVCSDVERRLVYEIQRQRSLLVRAAARGV